MRVTRPCGIGGDHPITDGVQGDGQVLFALPERHFLPPQGLQQVVKACNQFTNLIMTGDRQLGQRLSLCRQGAQHLGRLDHGQ
jgi:hypothetical protein